MTTIKAFSGLLELLQSRWDATVKELPDTYRPPILTNTTIDHIEKAARLHAAAHHSDPFAYGRVKLHIRRGLADFSTTRNDALSRLAALADGHVGIHFPTVTK